MNFIKHVRRWWRDRCEHCGHRFAWRKDARHSFGNRDGKIYHAPCIGYLTWHTKAEERLDVLRVACEVGNLTDRDIKGVIEMRAKDDGERVAKSNLAFRVFHDLRRSS